MGDFSVQGSSLALPSFNPSGANDGPAAVSRRGEQITIPYQEAWSNKEHAYMISNVTRNTALAMGGTSFSDTAPALLMDVAAGTTVKNFHLRLRQGGTVAGGVITVILTTDVIARYSSGGTAITVRNMKQGGGVAVGNRRASGVTVYGTTPTAAAVNTAITLYATILTQDVGAGTLVNSPNASFDYPSWGEIVPELVGPASIVLYTFAGTTQPSWFFHADWLEVDS